MSFLKCMDLVPDECNEKTRSYIKRKIEELNRELKILKVKCGMCKIDGSIFKENREKLVAMLRKSFPNSMVLLKGNELKVLSYCSKVHFQQDSNFYWAFGLEKPGLWGAIDVETGTSYIFYDSYVEKNKMLYSDVHPENYVKKYHIDKVISTADMKDEISKLGRNIFLVLSDMSEERLSEMSHGGVAKVLADCGMWMCNTVLNPVLKICRRVKSSKEQTIMALAAKLNSEGIVFVMQNMKPEMKGYCTGALFDLYISSKDRHVSKARPISCLSGDHIFCMDHSRSTFFLKEDLKSGDLCILNMGIALRNYKTNLIATVPVNGMFSDTQAVIYDIVLEMRSAMLQEIRPGISFAHLKNTARVTMVKYLIQNFILEGSVNDIIDSGICEALNPNGIGHFLGIDFYDCEERTFTLSTDIKRSIDHLVAKNGMVLALNSELYLNQVIIEKWMDTPAGVYLQTRYLSDYFGVAARVQDVVLIRPHSVLLLSDVPRTIDEIVNTMSQKLEIPFNNKRKFCDPKPKKSLLNMNLEKFSLLNRKVTDNVPIGKSLLMLRYENEHSGRMDLHRILKKIKERRKWKPMEYLNQIMKEVYSYPYKARDMLELIMIPLIPKRRRPSFIPYPHVEPNAQEKVKFPERGYGCPYFKWNEQFESCMRMLESCEP